MRGGSIPLLAWGTLLLVLAIGNLIWDAKAVNAATAFFAAFVVYGAAIVVRLRSGRAALRRGAPERQVQIESAPQASTGPVIIALGFASLLFGFTFSSFLIYFGAGLILLGVGRAVVEVRAERATRERVAKEQPR